jgi:5-aminolevulinate synthase
MNNQLLHIVTERNIYREKNNLTRSSQPLKPISLDEWPLCFSENEKEKVINFCSNSYFGLHVDEKVIEGAISATRSYGAGSGGTFNISGLNNLVIEIEIFLAKTFGVDKSSAILFSSGYAANDIIYPLANLDEVAVVCDELSHASMIQPLLKSKAKRNHDRVLKFKHNNFADLEQKIIQLKNSGAENIIIFIEEFYSMEGDIPNFSELKILKEKYNALLIVDGTHSYGVFGKNGIGAAEEQGCFDIIDIYTSTLAKAAGVEGGFVVCKNTEMANFLRAETPSFIYTTIKSPSVLGAIYESIKIIHSKHGDILRNKLRENVSKIISIVRKSGVSHISHDKFSHIILLKFSSVFECKQAADIFLENGIFLRPIFFPTVKVGDERIRVSGNAKYTDEQINHFKKALNVLIGKE